MPVNDLLAFSVEGVCDVGGGIVSPLHDAAVGVVHESLAAQSVVTKLLLVALRIGVAEKIIEEVVAVLGLPDFGAGAWHAVIGELDDFFDQSKPTFTVFIAQPIFGVAHSSAVVGAIC